MKPGKFQKERKIPLPIMSHLLSFVTMDTLINHSCKLTRRDRELLSDSSQADTLDQPRNLNVVFESYLIDKPSLDYFLKFTKELSLTFYEV